MRTPRLTVLLPVYNAARYVAQAVQSVLAQTFTDFELICTNDGSTDRSVAILKRFAARDRRVWVLDRPNTGLVGALTEGLVAARAPLVARMDADDVCLPRRFERQIAYMDANPDCVLLGTMVRAIDPHGLPLWESDSPTDHAAIDAELMKGRGGVIRHPTVLMRRDTVHRVGGYRPEFDTAEDLDLFLRLAEVGRVANLPEIHLLYRQHYGSVNRTRFDLQARRATAAVREAAERRGVRLPDGWAYRPDPPKSPYEQLREWGWKALKERRADIARRHARSLVGMSPWKLESWRLLACALRGY